MTDEADEGNHQMELMLAAARLRRVPGLNPVGKCHNCEERLPEGRLFCDADCRDDWAKRNRNRPLGTGEK